MHPNEALVRRFYDCFAGKDAAGMAACYHADVVFSDPAFGELRGGEPGAMWAMLLSRATDLEAGCDHASANDARGIARWHARYTFSQTGRPVLNRVEAAFEFRDGLIVRHLDHFSFWRWARQALGPVGLLLGWSPMLKRKVQTGARRGLVGYMRSAAAASAAD